MLFKQHTNIIGQSFVYNEQRLPQGLQSSGGTFLYFERCRDVSSLIARKRKNVKVHLWNLGPKNRKKEHVPISEYLEGSILYNSHPKSKFIKPHTIFDNDHQNNFRFDTKYGVPVIQKKLRYGDFLRDIRRGLVKEISYFQNRGRLARTLDFVNNFNFDHNCIVVYHDGSLAVACVSPHDARLAYAIETHGVSQSFLINKWIPTAKKRFTFATGKLKMVSIPVFLLFTVYLMTQIVVFGDWRDRKNIREYDERLKREKEERLEFDRVAQLPFTMAGEGFSIKEIMEEVKHHKLDYTEEFITDVLNDVKALREELEGRGLDLSAKAKEAPEPEKLFYQSILEYFGFGKKKSLGEKYAEVSEKAKAQDKLKMQTVEIQRAILPSELLERELRIKLKEAQSNMRGIRLYSADERRMTFKDVAGIGEIKDSLSEIVDFFVKPGKFKASGAKVPKGFLMCGPPGTGKTLLAKCVAGEALISFLSVNASEFVEMFAGLGAARVRSLFKQAREIAPAIIFIDEIDAVGRQRGIGSKGNEERDQTLNQLLIEMDGFEEDHGLIVMAATNRVDILDAALIRPGRFDRIVEVNKPTLNGRVEILKVHVGYRRHAEDIDYMRIALETAGFSGAQLAGLVNSASMIANKEKSSQLEMSHLVKAVDDVSLGPKWQGLLSKHQLYRLSVKEAGKALLSFFMPSFNDIRLVTIVPREKLLTGQTILTEMEANNGDKGLIYTKQNLLEQLVAVLAGRAAEEIICGADDLSVLHNKELRYARKLAYHMVYAGGMVTDDDVNKLDEIIRNILSTAYDFSKKVILRNQEALNELIRRLATPQSDADTSSATFNGNTLLGSEVSNIVEGLGFKPDLQRKHDGNFLDGLEI